MTDSTPAPCPRLATVVPPSALLPPVPPTVAHGPCCYWDHLTARWVPSATSTTG